ncbi:MAG: YafY family transcriptional regulator [Anaerolineales bacterium]|nr:YafY family transcriptional regulator [Anaerolineales bacterium]
MTSPAARLITLIMLLQRQPNQKAAELADKLGVSVRTLHRYFEMLDEMGIPVYTERGPHGGFSLVRGYKLPPLVFTPEEAAAVYLGASLVGQMWGQLYQAPAQGAMAKLDNVLPDEQRSEIAWAQRSLVATGMHRADPTALSPLLEKIRRAARQRRQIKISYQGGASPSVTERRVDPYALVHRSGWWLLVGYCHLRQALRTFRVDRIQELQLLGQVFEIPEGFDIHAYLEAEFKGQPVVRARLRFLPEAAHIAAANLANWESLQENPNGSVDVILAAPDLSWLASWAMSFAAWVSVLDPPELRALVREWALATAALYPVES